MFRVVKIKKKKHCLRRRVRTFDPCSVKEVSECWDTGGMAEAGLFIWILLSPVHSLLPWRIRGVGVEAPWPSALTKLAPKPTSDLTFPHHAIAVLSWSWPLAPALSPFTPVDATSRSRSVVPLWLSGPEARRQGEPLRAGSLVIPASILNDVQP